MLRRLRQSRRDSPRQAVMNDLVSVDLLILDDFALEPMRKEESRRVPAPPRVYRAHSAQKPDPLHRLPGPKPFTKRSSRAPATPSPGTTTSASRSATTRRRTPFGQ